MNLFISSFKFRRTWIPASIVVAMIVVVNVFINSLPGDDYWNQFHDSVQISKSIGKEVQVIIFGDSRATNINRYFFKEKVLSFAAPNNTLLFAKLLFEKIISETEVRPKVVIITLGANNFNQNGIFALRDYGVRRLANFSDLLEFTHYSGGLSYAVDGLFAKLLPVYGRRVEIRTPSAIAQLYHVRGRQYNEEDLAIPGMRSLGDGWLDGKSARNEVEDTNYWLIYKRSVYANYSLSSFHTSILENLIRSAQKIGAKVVVVQMPVEKRMQKLEQKLVGNVFDNYLLSMQKKYHFIYLDKRADNQFEFEDLNHLSVRGHKKFADLVLSPILTAQLHQQNKNSIHNVA